MSRSRRTRVPLLSFITIAISVCVTCANAQPEISQPRHSALPVATPQSTAKRSFIFPTVPGSFLTLRPNTTVDTFDPADIAAPGTGRLSLREAFALANQFDVETAIVLERGAVYRLERCGPLEGRANVLNELVHRAHRTLTINGNGATVFQDCEGAGVIIQDGGDQLLNLVDLSISGGRSHHTPAGGVWSSGSGEVRVTNAVLADNQVSITPNAGQYSAGAVASNGHVIISGSTFAHNIALTGIGAVAALGSVKAIKSTFYANKGSLAGAVLTGPANASVSANGPPPFTGLTPPGLTLIYSTIADNSRPELRMASGSLTAFATVISAPGSGTVCELDQARVNSLGQNYLSGGTGCGIGTGHGDRSNSADPQLRPVPGMKNLDVLAPAEDSPLVDFISANGCMPESVRELLPVYAGGTSDQLGVPRPQGGGCEIGAIEAVRANALSRQVPRVPLSDFPMPARWGPPELGLVTEFDEIHVSTTEDSVGQSGLSLRDALAIANHSARGVTIVLEPHKIYRLTRCAPPQTAKDNDTNDLVYEGTEPLRLRANGSTIVQTCDGSGVLSIFADERVSLADVTIAGGRSVIHPGGGIYMAGAGELRLERAWVTDNTTVAAGGGIASFGPVVLLDSTISGNHSAEVGGGVIGTADVIAVNSSLFNNTAALAIGAIGNHSGRLTLLFSTISDNSAPNIAVGSLAAFGSIITNYKQPPEFPGASLKGSPSLARPHDGPPPGSGNGVPRPGGKIPDHAVPGPHAQHFSAPAPSGPGAGAPSPLTQGGAETGASARNEAGPAEAPAGPGGFPPPANCNIERPGAALLESNYSTDHSCGFATVGPDPRLVSNRSVAPSYLAPLPESPILRLIRTTDCAPYRGTTDQAGQPRTAAVACAAGSIAHAINASDLANSGTSK